MKLKPLFDRVVLLPEEEKETKGGIILPTATAEKSQIARVVAVGNGKTFDGKDVGMLVSVGDRVLFNKYSGTEVTIDDVKHIVIRQADILAVIE